MFAIRLVGVIYCHVSMISTCYIGATVFVVVDIVLVGSMRGLETVWHSVCNNQQVFVLI